MPKKKILLLTTGGTIASHKTEYGLAPALTAEEILDFLPSMSSICHLVPGISSVSTAPI